MSPSKDLILESPLLLNYLLAKNGKIKNLNYIINLFSGRDERINPNSLRQDIHLLKHPKLIEKSK